MSINLLELQRLRQDCQSLTGYRFSKFLCPITLEDSLGPRGLMNGHILCQGIDSASSKTVIQRADVDNYFGHTIEPDLVTFANLPLGSEADFLKRARTLVAVPDGGEAVELFFADDRAAKKFPRLDLKGSDGEIVARPFLRTTSQPVDLGITGMVTVKGTIPLRWPAIVGSMLKAAYLAAFEVLGYRWALDHDGDYVRRALYGFLTQNARDQAAARKGENPTGRNAERYFRPFSGCVQTVLDTALDGMPDTITGNAFLIHVMHGRLFPQKVVPVQSHALPPLLTPPAVGLVFAISCLFRVNGRTLVVSLPCHRVDGEYFAALSCYHKYLADPNIAPQAHYARLIDGRWNVNPRPLNITYRDEGVKAD